MELNGGGNRTGVFLCFLPEAMFDFLRRSGISTITWWIEIFSSNATTRAGVSCTRKIRWRFRDFKN